MSEPLHSLLAVGGPPGLETGLPPTLGLLLGLFLVLLNGFFVAAEFALVKVRPTQIDPHVEAGDRRGVVARHMVRHLDSYLSATQLGITLASLALGWIGEPAFAWLLDPIVMQIPGASPAMLHTVSLTAAFLVITVLHIVLGELAPKSLAIRKPEATSLWVSIPLYTFYKVSFPMIWVLNHAANGLLRIFGIEPVSEDEMQHSEEELRLLLSSTGDEISEQKRELIDNVFEISNRTARQIMIPRADVVYLSTERELEENLRIAKASGHTRFPLCGESLDEVIGLVHIKDLFHLRRVPTDLEPVARSLTYVPESLTLDRLLRRMRAEKSHLAAVLDEYGGVSGVVTLEDVIEEIVGEIQDEFDAEGPELVALDAASYRVDGGMLIDELETELEIEISDRDEDTIGGVALSELGRRPRIGDQVDVGPLRLRVVEIDQNRIKAVEVELGVTTEEPEPVVESAAEEG